MTTFATANLPATVTTLERLFIWSGGALYQLHKNTRYQEGDGAPLIPIITAQDGLAADKSERIILRASLPLSDNWRAQTTRIWQESLEVANTPIPAGFLP